MGSCYDYNSCGNPCQLIGIRAQHWIHKLTTTRVESRRMLSSRRSRR